ncbi:hypothetical protein BAE44_0006037 [Dichanthelium oligosanthes]|uniref:Uncharacterized protein n=1 Tax=Dichanthelium oligosanthes TaxID=888268 RepID=A0A1E5W6C3_9POAL|nr:hypothetical protein BAE44_0006037 [Dichanthelium oligosanthes]
MWSQYGAYLRQARRICATELFSAKRLESFEYIRDEELSWLDLQGYVGRLKKASKTFDLFLNHILEHNRRRRLEGEGFVVKDMVDVLLQLPGDPNLEVPLSRDNVKALTQVIPQLPPSQISARNFLNGLLPGCSSLVKQRIQKFYRRCPFNFPQYNTVMVQDMILGGSDTTTMTIEWAISELLRNPELLAKATEELDRIVGREHA